MARLLQHCTACSSVAACRICKPNRAVLPHFDCMGCKLLVRQPAAMQPGLMCLQPCWPFREPESDSTMPQVQL